MGDGAEKGRDLTRDLPGSHGLTMRNRWWGGQRQGRRCLSERGVSGEAVEFQKYLRVKDGEDVEVGARSRLRWMLRPVRRSRHLRDRKD